MPGRGSGASLTNDIHRPPEISIRSVTGLRVGAGSDMMMSVVSDQGSN